MVTAQSKRRRNKRNSFVPTKVIGVRAECVLWDKIDKTAGALGTTRNDLVVSAVNWYCDFVLDKKEVDGFEKFI
jgi:hypothetical protein